MYSVEAVREVLEPELHGTLVLDMAGVEFIDESGLALLVAALKRLRQQGGSLVLRNPSDPLSRALDVTGIVKLPDLNLEREAGTSSPP
jgi:anti-sigma B factor antagonist